MSSHDHHLHATRMNPFHRQEIMVRRLLLTQQKLQWQKDHRPDSLNHGNSMISSSQKRQLPPEPVGSSSGADDDMTENVEIIETDEAWQELSSMLPMLTYGEESNTLLSILLGLPGEYAVTLDGRQIGTNNANVKRTSIICCPTCSHQERSITTISSSSQQKLYFNDTVTPHQEMVAKLLSDTVERLLQMKNSSHAKQINVQEIAFGKKRPKLEHNKVVTTTTDNTIVRQDHPSKLLLPWNVLLRVVIRLSSHAASIMQSSSSNNRNYCCTCNELILSEKQKNEIDVQGIAPEDKKSTVIHPILQALDIILSEIHVSMRITVTSAYSPPVKKEQYDEKKDEVALATTRVGRNSISIPKDRFLYDWKKSSHCTRETATASCWGPSRYEFMKDVESVTAMLTRINKTLGISVTEWEERINSIVGILDEQCGVGVGGEQGQHRYSSPLQSRSTTTLGDGSYVSSPLASVTRDNVKRILNSAEAEKKKCRKHYLSPAEEDVLSSSKFSPPKEEKKSLSCLRNNLQQVFKSEKGNDELIMEGETNELEDAYRMAIAFSSPGVNEEVRETIERRLSTLTHMLLNNNQKKFSLDGAESYLESLLNTLMQPSDPSVWVRLLKDSGGKETLMMLRRGRAALVSYLAWMNSPGWKDNAYLLIASPVPSQLGFLSNDEFLLPSLDKDVMTLPPAPIVTEVGLSVCIRNTLEGNDAAANKSPINTSGISLFRGFDPYPSSNHNDDLMNSITAPLPNTMELTRDLFDLILRLAADDDTQHQNKSFPLRLIAPSPAESLDIVLQVASDFSDWLFPHSISDRYRFILEQVCQSFQSFDHLGDSIEGESKSWTSRASKLLYLVKSPHLRARITLYATQFFILACGKGGKRKQKTFRNSSKQPHFYALLQQRQFSKFWDDIDGAAHGISSRSIISRVFDLSLCQDYILPLALKCALFLTERNHSSCTGSQAGQDALSLVTILGSVLNLLAKEDLIQECTEVGWAVELLSFSFSYYLFGVDNAFEKDDHIYPPQMLNSTCMWEQAGAQMNKLYNNVWGRGTKNVNSDRHWQTLDTAKNYISYENIGSNPVDGRMILIPSFNVLVSALIQYACSITIVCDDVAESWCKFVSNVVFDRYIQALGSVSAPERNKPDTFDKTVRSLWIRYLTSTLQQMITEQTTKKVNERSMELLMEDLVTPLLRRLHIKVMKRALRYKGFDGRKGEEQTDHRLPPDLVATIFTDLFKQESEHFLTKPSPSKTRKWEVYRKCIEKVFLMTPPSSFFAHPSQPGLSGYSSDALAELWKIFGQCSLTQSTLIMVAAGLHVNASATHLMPNQQHLLQDKELLKQRYNSFSTCVKQCIISSYGCLDAKAKSSSQVQDSVKFNNLSRSVRRDLSFHGEAGIGLTWWNEITNDLNALIEESSQQVDHSRTTGKKAGSRQSDIAAVFSSLQHDLSAISHNQYP